MSKLLDKIVFIGSLIAIVGLLGSYTARYIDPNTFVIPSLLGLAYPYLLLSNLLLLLYWIARWKKPLLSTSVYWHSAFRFSPAITVPTTITRTKRLTT